MVLSEKWPGTGGTGVKSILTKTGWVFILWNAVWFYTYKFRTNLPSMEIGPLSYKQTWGECLFCGSGRFSIHTKFQHTNFIPFTLATRERPKRNPAIVFKYRIYLQFNSEQIVTYLDLVAT